MVQCGSYADAMSLLTKLAVTFHQPCCSHHGTCSIFQCIEIHMKLAESEKDDN